MSQFFKFSSVQFSLVVQSSPTLCDPMNPSTPASLFITISRNSLRLMSIESVMPSSHFILGCPLLLLPLIFCSIRVFPMSWLLASSGQSIGASASASVLPMNIQCRLPLGLTGLIFLFRGLPRVSSGTTVQKHQFFGVSAFFMVQLSHPYMTTGGERDDRG